ncbi:MAG: type II secretion system protein GspM [Nitrospinota bacterium]|nr:type II secretion system protein GspM [Nitrospinota bacterium]
MIQNLTQRDKQFIITGGVVAAIIMLYTFVAEPVYLKQKGIEEKIQNRISFIEKYYAVLNQKPVYEQKSKTNQDIQSKLARYFFQEKKPALAAANLQKTLEGFARQFSISIERVRIGKPKYISNLLAIPVEISLRSNLRNLSNLIQRIENHEKFLIIEKITAKTINVKSPSEELQTQLIVIGFTQELEPEKNKSI